MLNMADSLLVGSSVLGCGRSCLTKCLSASSSVTRFLWTPPGCWREVRSTSRKSFLKNRAYSPGPTKAGKARRGELNLLFIPGRVGGRPLRLAPASFIGSERGHKSTPTGAPFFHRHAQASTGKPTDSSCQEKAGGLSSRQIEPGSLKNLAAQLKEGAAVARPLRPQSFSARMRL